MDNEKTSKEDYEKFRARDQTLQEYYQREIHGFYSTLITLSTSGAGVLLLVVPNVFPLSSLLMVSRVLFGACFVLFSGAAILIAFAKYLDHKQAYDRVLWERAIREGNRREQEKMEKAFKSRDKATVIVCDLALASFVGALAAVVFLVLAQLIFDP